MKVLDFMKKLDRVPFLIGSFIMKSKIIALVWIVADFFITSLAFWFLFELIEGAESVVGKCVSVGFKVSVCAIAGYFGMLMNLHPYYGSLRRDIENRNASGSTAR
jgi:hypothetical protein